MQLAHEKFDSEVDLKNIIMALRVSKFVGKMETNKRQRDSIAYFRRYTIDDNDVMNEKSRRTRREEVEAQLGKEARRQLEQHKLDAEKERVIEGCEPGKNANDRRVLFELTGRRFKPEDFPPEDETSEEED